MAEQPQEQLGQPAEAAPAQPAPASLPPIDPDPQLSNSAVKGAPSTPPPRELPKLPL